MSDYKFKVILEDLRTDMRDLFGTMEKVLAEYEESEELQAKLIVELEDGIREVRDLLRTDLTPSIWNMTQEEWKEHKINKAAGELNKLLKE